MNRDEFERLAKCAKDVDVCSRQIFKTNETDPYFISAKFAPILKAEHQMESDRIKLIYDVICDQSMLSEYSLPFFESANTFPVTSVQFYYLNFRNIFDAIHSMVVFIRLCYVSPRSN